MKDYDAVVVQLRTGDYLAGCNDAINTVLEIIDKDIDFYRQLGKPENQHRDVINAFTDFRRSIVSLKEGEQE